MRSAFGISLLFNTFLLWAKALGGGARAAEPGRPGGFGHSDVLLPLGSPIEGSTKKIIGRAREQNSGRGRFLARKVFKKTREKRGNEKTLHEIFPAQEMQGRIPAGFWR